MGLHSVRHNRIVLLLYLAAGLRCWGNSEQRQLALVVLGAQNHTLANDAAHCAWWQVGDEAYLLAYKLLGVEVLCHAREDCACCDVPPSNRKVRSQRSRTP